jgi:hypothetical protein
MTQSLSDVAAALRAASATVAGARGSLMQAALGLDVFGGGAVGQPGRVGVRLHQLWAAALEARMAEAADMAERLDDAAHAVVLTSQRYAEAEQATQQGWAEGV